MKKSGKEKRLPKLKVTTLRLEELKQATGGLFGVAIRLGCGTAGTKSVCHVDGTTDWDYAAY